MLIPRAAALLTALRPPSRSVVRLVHTEKRLAEIGIMLPPPGGPKANYNVACFESPTLLYVSGHLPIKADGSMITGSLGPDGLTLEQGQEAARWCGLNLISTIQDQLGGDLDRVERIVKLFGIVSSKQEFKEQHLVLNGCSDLMMEVFEDRGYHARSAIGTNTLPLGIAVEVEAVVKVREA
jgi:enamine deaminase RidA (YjgF/YER057c/UK114 family)